MEGQAGTVIEMGGTSNTQISVSPEAAEVSSEAPKATVAKQSTSEDNDGTGKEPKEKSDVEETRNETTEKENEQPQQQEKQPQPENEPTEEQIKEEFDKLWDSLDDKMKKRFTKLLKDDKEGKEKKLSEISIELIRALKLMFAIISLVVSPFKEAKLLYSGKDLPLSDTPPEGNDKKYLSKDSDSTKPQDSWRNFKEQVEKMEPMPFGDFMNFILVKNSEYSKDLMMMRPEKEENNEKKLELLKMLISSKVNGKGPRSSQRVTAPPRAKSPRG